MTAPTIRETADHAELGRLANEVENNATPLAVSLYRNATAPHHVLALLSEIAALRGERDGLKNRVSCLERLGGEQSTRVMEQATRAKDAERQRDEVLGLLREVCITQNNGDLDARIFRALANQGAE